MKFSSKRWELITVPLVVTGLTICPAKAESASAGIGFGVAAYLAGNQLNNAQLAQIRGGINTTSGVVINFAFQEATYVNYNLVQSVVLPTLTVTSGGSVAGAGGISASSLMAASNAINQLANVPSTLSTIVNNGATTVTSTVGSGGVGAIVSNTANAQVIQQYVNANIGVTGLSQSLQSGLSSTVLNHAMTNAVFH